MQNTPIRQPLNNSGVLTRWKNPTAHAYTLDLHEKHAVNGDEVRGIPGEPAVCHRIVIQPGEVVAIPSKFDEAIQKTRCLKCSDATSMRCANPTHPREVIAGLGVKLQRLDGPQPRLAPAFLDADVEAAKFERDERNKEAQRQETIAQLAREQKGTP